MEQKSGYGLQTALLQGENTRQHVSPSTGEEQETVSGVQIHQNSELCGFLEESQVI